MSNYKLSIVAAVYNLEKYLPRCLDALVNQTLQEIEILCVDDGSTDSAPQIIDEYAKKYPNKVKAFHKTNRDIIIYAINCENVSLTAVNTDEYITPIVYNVADIIIINKPILYTFKSIPYTNPKTSGPKKYANNDDIIPNATIININFRISLFKFFKSLFLYNSTILFK